MTKIIKYKSYWKQKAWFVLLLVSILIQLLVHRSNPYFLVTYLILGVIGIYLIFFSKVLKDDFISWDDTTITIRESDQEYFYTKEDIDQVSFGNNHLKIKSGPANGLLLDLEGYKADDIRLLKSFLDLPETAVVDILTDR